MTSTTIFHLVRQGSAAKLGANSSGSIQYAVLIDAEHTEPYLALTGNDGGGYFSREAVPMSTLRHCAEQAGDSTPLAASAFKPAFVGRSTNNGYFAVAALCAEGLLNRVQREGPGRGQPLADAGIWDDWCAQVLTQAREQGRALPVFQIGKQAAADSVVEPTSETLTEEGQEDTSGDQSTAFAEADSASDDTPNDGHETPQDDAGEGEAATKSRRRGKART